MKTTSCGEASSSSTTSHDERKSERRLAAQYETTRVLAEADTPAQANAKILETICERLDWDYGAFWRVDAHTQRLRCASLWHRAGGIGPRVRGPDPQA